MPNAAFNRSRLTNGRPLYRGRPTADSRRLEDITRALLAERSGHDGPSIGVEAACRAVALLTLQVEKLSVQAAAGEAIASAELVKVTGALLRARRDLGPPLPKPTAAKRGRVVSFKSGAGAPPLGDTPCT